MDGISNTVHPRPPWPSRPRPPPHAGAPPRAVGTRLLPSPSSRFPPPPQPATPPARISKQETNGAQARPPFSSAARRLASPDGTPGGEAAAAAARHHARHVRGSARAGRDELRDLLWRQPERRRRRRRHGRRHAPLQVQAACRPPGRRLLRPADAFAQNGSRELRRDLRGPPPPLGASPTSPSDGAPRRAPAPA